MTSRPFERSSMVAALREAGASGSRFDVLVVGGGITGAGVALDAANRGLRVALVERDDFASGTSSKSSKFVHGGLRYLQHGDFWLVFQALRERRRLMRNAPHLVTVLPFLIPILTKDGVVPKRVARALGSAMWMYDAAGGWRIGKLHRRVSADEAYEHFPTTDRSTLSGGYLYYDATADDARLTLTVARTAAAYGAVVVNRCPVTSILRDDAGHACGATVDLDGETLELRADAVVNATGVWSDGVRGLDEPDRARSIRPAKGVHVVLPWDKVGNDISVIVPVRGDRRSLFLTPWGPRDDGSYRFTYVGTTDTDYAGSLDAPACDGDDIDYVLAAVNAALVEPVDRGDITGVWAGLRPLVDLPGERTADLSRQHVIETGPSGVVHVNGGKLTTYREMADDTVDAVIDVLRSRGRSGRWRGSTKRLRLLGYRRPDREQRRGSVAQHLGSRYGSMADEIRALIALDPSLGAPLVRGLPYLRAEAVYAVRQEMATTLEDVLTRRTRAHLFDRAATLAAAPDVAELMAAEIGWTSDERQRQLDAYRRRCTDEETAGGQLADATD